MWVSYTQRPDHSLVTADRIPVSLKYHFSTAPIQQHSSPITIVADHRVIGPRKTKGLKLTRTLLFLRIISPAAHPQVNSVDLAGKVLIAAQGRRYEVKLESRLKLVKSTVTANATFSKREEPERVCYTGTASITVAHKYCNKTVSSCLGGSQPGDYLVWCQKCLSFNSSVAISRGRLNQNVRGRAREQLFVRPSEFG